MKPVSAITRLTLVILSATIFLIATALLWQNIARADTAPGSEPPTALAWVASVALRIAAVAAVAAALGGLWRLLRLLEDRWKVSLSDGQERMVLDWARLAVDYAEEQAHKRVKAGLAKVTGPEKLEIATRFVMEHIEQKGWVGWVADQIAKRIETEIGWRRQNRLIPTNVPAAPAAP